MKRLSVALAWLCLLALGSCGWSNPALLRKQYPVTSPSICTDSKTKKAYAFYGLTKRGTKVESFVCFREIAASDELRAEVCALQDRMVEDVSAACDINGKNLYVAYSARREAGATECDGNVTGCSDVFFIESVDSGKTWTKAVAVPRGNMTDAAHRTDPKLLFVTERSRLFIAYTRHEPAENHYFLATVTRPKGSSIFANEIQLTAQWSRPLMNKTFAYNIAGDLVTIQIILEPTEYCFQRRYSSDNGKTWDVECCLGGGDIQYSMAMSPKKDRIYLAAALGSDFIVKWIGSDNRWVSKTFENSNDDFHPIIADVAETAPVVLFTGQFNEAAASTYTLNTATDVLTDLKQPPPLTPQRETSTLYNGATAKVRVLHFENDSLYLSTHS